MTRPPLIFLQRHGPAASAAPLAHHLAAHAAGFRTFVAGWQQLEVLDRGVLIHQAREIGTARPVRDIEINPAAVVHRMPVIGRAAGLLGELRLGNPAALFSHHPLQQRIGDKWNFETAFRRAEAAGISVPRPPTYLVEKSKLRATLDEIGQTRPLIFKPSGGSCCVGIVTSTPARFDAALAEIEASESPRYVVQDLIASSLLHEGRKFDLRLYVLVTSFRPLSCVVLREGVARLAAQAPDPEDAARPLSVLTGCTFRKRQQATAENLTVSDLLGDLAAQGVAVSGFWDAAEVLITTALQALGGFSACARVRNSFYFAGVDVLMVRDGNGFRLLFVEINDLPDLTGWGEDIDQALQPAYRHAFELLRLVCLYRRAAEAAGRLAEAAGA